VTELISGSMIDHWRRCQRQYHYAHDRKIAPRELPWPIALGRAGHGVLASYYSSLQGGAGHLEARQEALDMAGFRADILGHDQKALAIALPLVDYYWAVHAADAVRWEVLAVEHEVRVERGDWIFVATLDLAVREREPFGRVLVVDHRFLTEFYTYAMARLDPQLPRYVVALRQSGHPADDAVRNMISTKPVGASTAKADRGKVRRVPLEVTQRRLEIVNAETERTAREILAWRAIPEAARPSLAARTVLPGERWPSCKTCPFLDLCTAEAWGETEQAAELVATKYGPTDYGNWEA
jgi:hypothetical protein